MYYYYISVLTNFFQFFSLLPINKTFVCLFSLDSRRQKIRESESAAGGQKNKKKSNFSFFLLFSTYFDDQRENENDGIVFVFKPEGG